MKVVYSTNIIFWRNHLDVSCYEELEGNSPKFKCKIWDWPWRQNSKGIQVLSKNDSIDNKVCEKWKLCCIKMGW